MYSELMYNSPNFGGNKLTTLIVNYYGYVFINL